MSDNTKQIYNYTVILEKESDGGYHAFCPALNITLFVLRLKVVILKETLLKKRLSILQKLWNCTSKV